MALALEPANTSDKGFAIVDARYIGGHRVVASLADLYALSDWKLLNVGETDTNMALGQTWYVKDVGTYRLINWGSRKTSAGWSKVVDPNKIDTTLFQVVSVLPTSDIKSNRIYLVPATTVDPSGGNKYYEYIYTGDTGGTYDAGKWEKLGEYKAEYKPEVATLTKLGCVKSSTYTLDKGETISPKNTPVVVASDGSMNVPVSVAQGTIKGIVGVSHTEQQTDDGYEAALKTDATGNGYVTIGVISTKQIDAIFSSL